MTNTQLPPLLNIQVCPDYNLKRGFGALQQSPAIPRAKSYIALSPAESE